MSTGRVGVVISPIVRQASRACPPCGSRPGDILRCRSDSPIQISPVALVLGGVGVLVHVISNYDAGVLNYHYSATWPTMSDVERWWLASIGAVGPTPPLAPASLAFGALVPLLASVRVAVRVRAAHTAAIQPAHAGYDEATPQ